jgi:hypothetical protein
MAGARRATRGYPNKQQAQSLTADFGEFFRNLIKAVYDPYRPELHYMRGPGPKWHAKHDRPAVSYDAMHVPVLVRVKAR